MTPETPPGTTPVTTPEAVPAATPLDLDRSVLVMAHPDDEVLWASSLLARVGRLVLVYETLPGRPDVTAGRRAALARFPRQVESLRLAESAAFGAAAWPEPVETPEGLAVAVRPGVTMPGFDPGAYRAGFATTQVAYEEAYQRYHALYPALHALAG